MHITTYMMHTYNLPVTQLPAPLTCLLGCMFSPGPWHPSLQHTLLPAPLICLLGCMLCPGPWHPSLQHALLPAPLADGRAQGHGYSRGYSRGRGFRGWPASGGRRGGASDLDTGERLWLPITPRRTHTRMHTRSHARTHTHTHTLIAKAPAGLPNSLPAHPPTYTPTHCLPDCYCLGPTPACLLLPGPHPLLLTFCLSATAWAPPLAAHTLGPPARRPSWLTALRCGPDHGLGARPCRRAWRGPTIRTHARHAAWILFLLLLLLLLLPVGVQGGVSGVGQGGVQKLAYKSTPYSPSNP